MILNCKLFLDSTSDYFAYCNSKQAIIFLLDMFLPKLSLKPYIKHNYFSTDMLVEKFPQYADTNLQFAPVFILAAISYLSLSLSVKCNDKNSKQKHKKETEIPPAKSTKVKFDMMPLAISFTFFN